MTLPVLAHAWGVCPPTYKLCPLAEAVQALSRGGDAIWGKWRSRHASRILMTRKRLVCSL